MISAKNKTAWGSGIMITASQNRK